MEADITTATKNTHYDVLILGSGQAGNPLAVALAARGKRTAMIERNAVGGTCINYGCTPTKTMVASAEIAYLAGRGREFGVNIGSIHVDMAAVRERKRKMVKSWREGGEKHLAKGAVDLIRGEASFLAPKTPGVKLILVRLNEGGELHLTADLVVIDTGLTGNPPPLPGLDTVPFLDNVSIMELDQVPEHLLILGGGYIGLEFGQMFRRFGSRVTIVQDGAQLLTQEDEDIAEEITKILHEDGIEVLLSTHATSAGSSGESDQRRVRLTVTSGGAERILEGSHLLIATGRKPNTARLNLAAAGVATNARGFIPVDDKLETNVPGIYATGDVNGGPAFTHISYDDFRILNANLSGDSSPDTADGARAKSDAPGHSAGSPARTTKGRLLPYCVFLDPQLGRVGLSEKQATEKGVKVRVARLPMASVARSLETGQTRGFMKALVDPETQQILGAAVLGQDGGEIMAMLQIAMMGKLRYTELQNAVLAHPTLAESLNKLFSTFDGE
ncbi:MAG TPA: mercuric reductase [Granulicella sp.]|nr:mercuric reductase [Granulicella sp.]